jgi:hypothetical protein
VEGVGASAGAVLLSFNGSKNGVNEIIIPINLEKIPGQTCAPVGAQISTFLYYGTLLAEAVIPKNEVVVQKFLLEAKEPGSHTSFSGEKYGARIKSGSNYLRVSGELRMELESGEAFGPF